MKILFLADVPLHNPASGSEQVLYQQALGLVRKGLKVCAITRQDGTSSPVFRTVDRIKEACYSAHPQHAVNFSLALLRNPPTLYNYYDKEGPFDAVICHQPFTSLALLIRGKLRNMLMVYVFHSPSHEEYLLSNEDKGWLPNFLQVRARRTVEGFCVRRSVLIMVLSQYMKEKLVSTHRILPERIIVNHGGVDLERFKPLQNRSRLKEELGLPKDHIHLMTLRNLEPRMGLDNLLKSMCLLKKEHLPVHLILAGDGMERRNLENLVNEFSLSDTVTMTGFVPHEMLPKYYGASDFFVLPTRRLEGFGLVTPESMACGTPVLGTPVGGTIEILSDFDMKFLFEDTSAEAMAKGVSLAINKYFNHKKAYEELRDRCRIYTSEKYSWQRHTAQLQKIIEKRKINQLHSVK